MRKRTITLLAAAIAMAIAGFVGIAVAQNASCSNLRTIGSGATGSGFEIDTSANFIVNTTGCIDWLTGGTGTNFRTGVQAKNDLPSGSGDDSFGKGTAEDNPNPTIVDGSIPPQKSDLKAFGVFTEQNPPTPPNGFLALFWTRINSPQGTTNMDFELNKILCDGTAAKCANNGTARNPVYVTPKRSDGDALITYDLSQGGTNPTISIRFWDDNNTPNDTTDDEWGPATVIQTSGANAQALGSINTSSIAAADAGTISGVNVGPLDPLTFGEAVIDFKALFPNGTCGSFGSAYLKSRSSDSFTAEIKDFVRPEPVNVSNCPSTLTTNASPGVQLGGNPPATIHDTATLTTQPGTTGSIVFKLYKSQTDCQNAQNAVFTSTNTTVNGSGNYDSGNYTPTEAGTYYWTAQFISTTQGVSGAGPTACDDANEDVVVSKGPSSVSTAQNFIPNDSATITGTGTLGGTVTFKLYASLADCQADTNSVYSPAAVNVSGSSPQTVSTNNTGGANGYTVNAANAGNLFWRVTYSGDNANNGSSSVCVEDSSVTIDNTTPPA